MIIYTESFIQSLSRAGGREWSTYIIQDYEEWEKMEWKFGLSEPKAGIWFIFWTSWYFHYITNQGMANTGKM